MKSPKEATMKVIEKHISKEASIIYQNMIIAHNMMELADKMTPLSMTPDDVDITIHNGHFDITGRHDPEMLTNVLLHGVLDLYIATFEAVTEENVDDPEMSFTLQSMLMALVPLARTAFKGDERDERAETLTGLMMKLHDLVGDDDEETLEFENGSLTQKQVSVDDEELEELREQYLEIDPKIMIKVLSESNPVEKAFKERLQEAVKDPRCQGVMTEALPEDLMKRYTEAVEKTAEIDQLLKDNLSALGDE